MNFCRTTRVLLFTIFLISKIGLSCEDEFDALRDFGLSDDDFERFDEDPRGIHDNVDAIYDLLGGVYDPKRYSRSHTDTLKKVLSEHAYRERALAAQGSYELDSQLDPGTKLNFGKLRTVVSTLLGEGGSAQVYLADVVGKCSKCKPPYNPKKVAIKRFTVSVNDYGFDKAAMQKMMEHGMQVVPILASNDASQTLVLGLVDSVSMEQIKQRKKSFFTNAKEYQQFNQRYKTFKKEQEDILKKHRDVMLGKNRTLLKLDDQNIVYDYRNDRFVIIDPF